MLPIKVIRAADPIALAHNIPAGNLLAVIDKESAGRIFTNIGGTEHPVIRFEPHIFYRRLPGAKRDQAVAQGLASKRENRKLVPASQRDRWAQLEDASKIDATAAIEATSFGIGQVLGENWHELGYADAAEFMRANNTLDGQIDAMMRFIIANHLDDELRDGRWAAFARGYNGPKYRENHYDTDLAKLADYYGGSASGPDGMLRLGAKGAKVRELQALLVRAGQTIKVDGDYGPATKKAVMAFQEENGLTVDGVAGPETQRALAAHRQGATDAPGKQSPVEIPGVLKGLGMAAAGPVAVSKAQDAVDAATGQLQQYAGIQIVDYALAGLSLLGVGLAVAGLVWAAHSWLESHKTQEV